MKSVNQQQRFWLPSPPSVNELFNSGAVMRGAGTMPSRIQTKTYRDWIAHAQQELLLQKPGRHEGQVTLSFFFGERSPLADCTNFIKAPEDLLVSMGIIDGDNSKCVRGLDRVAWVPNYVGMVVHITPYRDSEPLWLDFDAGVLGQVQGSDPGKMGLHPQALGRINRLTGRLKPGYVPKGTRRGRPPKVKI